MSQLPSTSHEANSKATLEMRQCHWLKIKEALSILRIATGEQIAMQAGMDYHAVMRRLSEMERLEMIYKPGNKIPTKSGRAAYQYELRTNDTVLPVPENHYMANQTSAADIACAIIAGTKHQKLIQKDLFND